jgi:hypothetical protein
MKVSAHASMYICAAFALASLWFAWTALSSLERLTDAAERDMAAGYGGFWLFLAAVGAAFGVLSWAIANGKWGFREPADE